MTSTLKSLRAMSDPTRLRIDALLEKDALIQALRGLQRRQREVLVLRYYSDMTEAQVASALGLSIGSVKAYGSRGIEALRNRLEEQR